VAQCRRQRVKCLDFQTLSYRERTRSSLKGRSFILPLKLHVLAQTWLQTSVVLPYGKA